MNYEKLIGSAIDWEIKNWQERQIDALNQVALPLLSEKDDELLKTITLLNTAWGSTKVLLPPVKEAALAAAIPFHILGQAQSRMTGAYKKYLSNINSAMSERYTGVRDSMVNEIQAIARSFKGTEHGTKLIHLLRDNVFCPVGLDTENKLEVFYREVLFQSNMITTDPKTIRKQTKDGFETLLGNIKNIYLASYHGPCWGSAGNMNMYYSDSGSKLPVHSGWPDKAKMKERAGQGRVSHLTSNKWIIFEGYDSARASQCIEHAHTAHIRKKQDEILANGFRMETKRFYTGQYGFDDLYVSKKDTTDYSKPASFTAPSSAGIKAAAGVAMTEMKRRGVVN